MTTQLSPSQHAILAHAINHTSGQIDWFPGNIKGGARKKVLDAMFNRALITNDGTNWIVAAEGYDALGAPRPMFEGTTGASQVLADEIGTEVPTDAEIDASNTIDPEIEAAVPAIETAALAETKALWKNVFGTTASNSDKAPYIKLLDDGMSAGTLAWLAADTSFNKVNINLVGLAQTGIEYIPT